MEIIITYLPIWLALLAGIVAVGIGYQQKKPKVTMILVVILALAGIGMLVDLAYIHFTEASSVCDINETVSCSAVNTSEFSEVLGIPIAFFGIGFFLAALLLVLRKKEKEKNAAFVVLLTMLAIIPAIYLSAIEYFVIDVVCPFCEASKVLMLAIAALMWPMAKKTGLITDRAIAGLVLLGVAGSAFTYMLQVKTAGLGEDHTALIECLQENNVVMYGSFTCASCAAQRRILGEEAFHEAELEIECNSRGENPQTQLCLEREILHTPTWAQNDIDGKEILRVDGVQKPEKLAELFGCEEALAIDSKSN